jgi:2-polyprenyl-3-methyl-5-hydroxy-6-metoxy-1,4-benzoquinol methylase
MYVSETQKIRPVVEKYCHGSVVDIGCGDDLIVPSAVGVDVRKTSKSQIITDKFKTLSTVLNQRFDTVFSSHCLEHIDNDVMAVRDWISLLNDGGHLILYLPSDDHYDNKSNPDHLHWYKHESFIAWFGHYFPHMNIIDHGMDIGEDKYSFYLVAKK